MATFDKIETFLEQVEDNSEYTGDVSEQFLDGDMEIRLSIGRMNESEPRSGSFSILLKTDADLQELAMKRTMCAEDIEERFGEVEREFVEMTDEYFGYNAYEPIIDEADRPQESEFDIVVHDSVQVYE